MEQPEGRDGRDTPETTTTHAPHHHPHVKSQHHNNTLTTSTDLNADKARRGQRIVTQKKNSPSTL